jgi:Sec7 domain
MTAPTLEVPNQPDQDEMPALKRRRSKFHPFSRQKQSNGPVVLEPSHPRPSSDSFKKDKVDKRKSRFGALRPGKDPLEELRKLAGSRGSGEMLSINEQKASSSLGLPLPRQSESTRSDGDFREQSFAGANIASPERPQAPRSNTTFTWRPRRNKNRNSLFPLPVRIPPPETNNDNRPSTPRASMGARSSISPDHSPANSSPLRNGTRRSRGSTSEDLPHYIPSHVLPSSTISFAPPGSLLRTASVHSAQSSRSSPATALDMRRKGRQRSSTFGSSGGLSEDAPPPTPPFAAGGGSGRNSTSTAGRSSFSNLFALNRFRHSSDPHSPRQSSPGQGLTASGLGSHTNSFNLSREAIPLPERQEGETALQYLSRVEETVPRSQVPTLLSKSTDEFNHNVMRSFMRKFAYFGDPLDMALRKLLMEVDLPKETQQIDRVLQSFSDRYHECNPGIFATAGELGTTTSLMHPTNPYRKRLLHCFLHPYPSDGCLQQKQQAQNDEARLCQKFIDRGNCR